LSPPRPPKAVLLRGGDLAAEDPRFRASVKTRLNDVNSARMPSVKKRGEFKEITRDA